jgi:3-deoxy-D-manno-octulosonic-acid transferase
MLIIFETELWPNLIKIVSGRYVKVGIVNARISDKNFKRMERFQWFIREVLSRLDFILARSEIDTQRFTAFGAQSEKIILTGNMKFDLQDLPALHVYNSELYKEFGIHKHDMIVTAGSIREGEEVMVIEAYKALKQEIPNVKLFIAPRHLENT